MLFSAVLSSDIVSFIPLTLLHSESHHSNIIHDCWHAFDLPVHIFCQCVFQSACYSMSNASQASSLLLMATWSSSSYPLVLYSRLQLVFPTNAVMFTVFIWNMKAVVTMVILLDLRYEFAACVELCSILLISIQYADRQYRAHWVPWAYIRVNWRIRVSIMKVIKQIVNSFDVVL